MLVSLSTAQREISDRFAELLNDELMPGIRRMGELPMDASPGELADRTATRAAVWRALVELGATRLLLPRQFGGGRVWPGRCCDTRRIAWHRAVHRAAARHDGGQ